MPKPQIVILGAGPAGLGAAYQLARHKFADVVVLERNPMVGGNAGSHLVAGMPVDFGSHRLHPSCDPEVLADIRELLGDDLMDRPRHGRIRLQGRWIHFPLKPADLAFHLSPSFSLGVLQDTAKKLVGYGKRTSEEQNFATVLSGGLGETITREFYFPYARKIWGLDPEELSPVQGKRRVGANSIAKMFRKALSGISAKKNTGKGRFYYPRFGFGAIAEAYHYAARRAGAQVLLGADVQAVDTCDAQIMGVRYMYQGQERSVPADHVWSTIPLTVLTNLLLPRPPRHLLDAARSLEFRSMILIYAVLAQPRFSEYDAHYFSEEFIPITRLSEPKNYCGGYGPRNRTVLCAELPCSSDDAVWKMTDESLGELLKDSLAKAGIPIQAPVQQIVTRRLRYAYPIYRKCYEEPFRELDRLIGGLGGLLTFGRQGLFAHDNTHHALYMAYSAVKCLDADGRFDLCKWQAFRQIFETHVVED